VLLDPTGKQNGRGAYVHESRACWDAALKRGRLAHALKVTVPPDDMEALQRHAETLPVEAPVTDTRETETA
jgi:predicted RNA-binding protein YlxR (DUF448 family)